LPSCQCGFKGATIPDAVRAPESGDQFTVNSDHLSHGRVRGH
jgi:hypothetical protein